MVVELDGGGFQRVRWQEKAFHGKGHREKRHREKRDQRQLGEQDMILMAAT